MTIRFEPKYDGGEFRRDDSLGVGLALLSAPMSEDLKGRAPDNAKTSFGFARVGEGAKQGLVNEVFARVAPRYDVMNDLMSGSLHRLWKDDLVSWLAPPRSAAPYVLLDVAGGTGDVALRALHASGPGASAVICDISSEMIEAGRRRAGGERLSFVRGNAEALPFAKGRFDAYTVAFGMRNLTHLEAALAEAFRVLKPGGRFLCLEFSAVEVPLLDRLYEAYSFNAIPALGRLVAGDSASYRYLVESIRRFPDQENFTHLIENAGFERVRYRNLSGGIAAIHSAWRL
jgi:demethylmenaquinone methyltransferase / 2-methoxy-6-polyprenyl-1,4-benzoquinol methylase